MSDDAKRATDSDRSVHVLDPGVLESLRELGGAEEPDLVLQLIELFLGEVPERFAEIEFGLANNDLRMLERAAHTLKSSSANIGALSLSELFRQIEEQARAQKTTSVAELVRRSKGELSGVEAAFAELRA